jgi:anti-sigma B factor antagonist
MATREINAATPTDGRREPDLRIDRHRVGHRTLLRVSGEIDIDTAPTVRSAIDAALERGALELWIDLSPTTFMDSSGVHLLLDARRTVGSLARRLAIICPPGAVRRVLEISGVADTLPLFEDLAGANRHA